MGALHQKYAYLPRLEALVQHICTVVQSGDRILDVGCGYGLLGATLKQTGHNLVVEGVESNPRGCEAIKVYKYDGKTLPFEANSFDIVVIADVLHHCRDPIQVLKECGRVAEKFVIVKDHLNNGWFSYLRICLLDWVANAPHGVPCLYKYWTLEEWQEMFEIANLKAIRVVTMLKLYHWSLNLVFGGSLHILAFTKPK